MRLLAALARPLLSRAPAAAPRAFTTLCPVRPAVTPSVRRPDAAPGPSAADVVDARAAVSAHPALAALQLRFGPRNTMNANSRLIQKRRHGFLARLRSRTGRHILQRRRLKGRKKLGW